MTCAWDEAKSRSNFAKVAQGREGSSNKIESAVLASSGGREPILFFWIQNIERWQAALASAAYFDSQVLKEDARPHELRIKQARLLVRIEDSLQWSGSDGLAHNCLHAVSRSRSARRSRATYVELAPLPPRNKLAPIK